MSKLEILKSFPTPADLRQNAQTVSESLQLTISSLQQMQIEQSEMKSELLKLPDLIIEQLLPLAALAPDLNHILKIQRESIEQLVNQVEGRIIEQMQPVIAELQKSVKASVIAMAGLDSRIIAAQTQIDQLAALPGQIVTAKNDLVTAKKQFLAQVPTTFHLICYILASSVGTGLIIVIAQKFLGT